MTSDLSGGCYYADACTLKACPSPRWYLRLTESELSSCLPYGLQQFAHDIRSRGVVLVQNLYVPCRSSEVAVAEPVPYPLQVDALVYQPRSMRVPDLVGRVPERQVGLLD